MRLLVSLALAIAVMAALVVAITLASAALAGSAGKAFEKGPMESGLIPRVAFILLWILVAGVAAGLVGAT